MGCVIDATAKGEFSNSYATIAEADAYHETHPYASAWENAGDDEKCRALVTATRLLDVWFDWYGSITSLAQRLSWPRSGVLRPNIADGAVGTIDNPWHEPFAVQLDPDEIPDLLIESTSELARQLLVSDRTADSDTETQGLKSIKAGPVALEFGTVVAKPIPDAVMVMASQLGRPHSRSGSGAVTMYRA